MISLLNKPLYPFGIDINCTGINTFGKFEINQSKLLKLLITNLNLRKINALQKDIIVGQYLKETLLNKIMIDRKRLNQGMPPNEPTQTLNLKLVIGQNEIRQKL